ncbi:hypothetical protein ACEWY4_023926 [Coilia grayii]|uniref:Type-4 ice-structuring protein LS-12-like n=1 Tax=Coilia grayii TaxID=363190 RepID=A0ABD1J2I5_9TELE
MRNHLFPVSAYYCFPLSLVVCISPPLGQPRAHKYRPRRAKVTVRSLRFCCKGALPKSSVMKVVLVAVLVVLALSHGSVNADANADIERLTQYFQDLSAKLTSTTQELVEAIKTHELTAQAQTYLQDGKAQLEPLAEKIQSQIKPLAANVEEQLKPLAESVQAQLKPLADSVQAQMEDLFKKILEQTKAIGQ